jgi:hypothetical protein
MRKSLRRHASNPLEGELYIRKRELYVKKNASPKQIFIYRGSHCRKDRGALRGKLAAAPIPIDRAGKGEESFLENWMPRSSAGGYFTMLF